MSLIFDSFWIECHVEKKGKKPLHKVPLSGWTREFVWEVARPRVQFVINRYEWFWKFSKLNEPLGECNLRIFKITSHELYEKVVWFFIYSTFNKITSFPWKLNRCSYGVQFGINFTALDQSKLSNFVECTITKEITEYSVHPVSICSLHLWCTPEMVAPGALFFQPLVKGNEDSRKVSSFSWHD